MYHIKVVHEARRLWSGNPAQKWLMAAILLLVGNDILFLGFLHMSNTGNGGKC